MQIIETNSPEETKDLARSLAPMLKEAGVIALAGELGAGKTCFVSGLVQALGSEAVVSSPTFSLVNCYPAESLVIYHFDMYRIDNYSDLESTGFFDHLSEEALLIIEWSEKIELFLPAERTQITFVNQGEGRRKITVQELATEGGA